MRKDFGAKPFTYPPVSYTHLYFGAPIDKSRPRTVQRPLSGAERLLGGMGLHGQPLLHAEVQSHWFLPGEAFLRQNAAQRIERKYHTGENLIAILSRVVSAAYDSDASSA